MSALGKGARLVHVRLPVEAAERLDHSDQRQGLTHNFNRPDLPSGSNLVAFVTCDGNTYRWVAVASKENATSTLQNRVRLTHVESVEPLPHSGLLRQMAFRLQRHARSVMSSASISCFPDRTGDGVVAAAASLCPGFTEVLQRVLAHLGGARAFAIPEGSPWSLVAQEKDGVDLCLTLAGLPTSRYCETGPLLQHPSPALSLLCGLTLEDRQIEVDAEAFGGYELISRDVRGARLFYDERRSTTVTVINVNRHPLEKTLGVDLIVHYERYDSILLVQYKRLVPEKWDSPSLDGDEPTGSAWRYRPSRDSSYRQEVPRMHAVRAVLQQTQSDNPRDYRLNEDPFFFKFCRADTIDPDSRGMVPGLYVMALDLERFLASSHSQGPCGGHLISYDNYPRRFPNTLFVKLAQDGWIGTRGVGSDAISRYVEGALASRKSLLLSRVTSGPAGPRVDRVYDQDDADL